MRQPLEVPADDAADAEEAHGREQPVRAARVLLALAGEDERAGGVDQPPRPRADGAGLQGQVEGTGEVARIEAVGRAQIDASAAVIEQARELRRRAAAARGARAARVRD